VTFHFLGSFITSKSCRFLMIVKSIFRCKQPDAITTIETTIGAIVVIETDAMAVVTIATAIAVIVDTIGIATATGVMTEIVTVPIRPEIITTINCNCRPDI
jgi:hypothetical protein